jgi:hypothetical protein
MLKLLSLIGGPNILPWVLGGFLVLGLAGTGYHFYTVWDYEKQISAYKVKSERDDAAIHDLKEAEKTWTAKNETLQKNLRDVIQEKAASDATAKIALDRASRAEAAIRSEEKAKQAKAIMKGGGIERLLRLENRSQSCKQQNYADFDGKCVNGVWVPTGKRYDEVVRGGEAP